MLHTWSNTSHGYCRTYTEHQEQGNQSTEKDMHPMIALTTNIKQLQNSQHWTQHPRGFWALNLN